MGRMSPRHSLKVASWKYLLNFRPCDAFSIRPSLLESVCHSAYFCSVCSVTVSIDFMFEVGEGGSPGIHYTNRSP